MLERAVFGQTLAGGTFGPLWRGLTSTPAVVLGLVLTVVAILCVLVGVLRSARAGGILVTTRRLVQRPAAPLTLVGVALIVILVADLLVIIFLPGL
jgi:uncharacterized membrane protein YidH (DUF202 family)